VRRLVPLVAAAALLVSAAYTMSAGSPSATGSIALTVAESTPPPFDPNNFVEKVDNPLFTLTPGTLFKLEGETADGIEKEYITVTHRNKMVLGVKTTIVRDVVRVNGKIAEFTYDWYAQDRDGNVWYFGENTAEMEDGEVVSREGSWEAGVDGAEPGIIMSADPQITDSYRQEFYKGHAEDMFWVVEKDVNVRVPFGKFDDAVRVLEWTPLEPKIVVEKLYVAGVGLVSEHALSGGLENVRLLDIIPPSR
jgi:hypothetical protein